MQPSQKEIAITKTQDEIDKDILSLVMLAKNCGLGELQYFLHYLHFIRVVKNLDEIQPVDNEKSVITELLLTDAYKYIIQLLIKYMKEGFIQNQESGSLINGKLVHQITERVISLNNKFEMLSMLTMFDNVTVSGERNQDIRFDMDEIMQPDIKRKYLNYFLRASMENNFQKENPLEKSDFFTLFKKEYHPYKDLFLEEFGISVDEFIDVLNWFLIKFTTNVSQNENGFDYLTEEMVDVKGHQTILLFSFCMFIKKQDFYNEFGDKFDKILQRLTFQSSEFNENELKYNRISREPIISMKDIFIVSPELLLDSLFVNTHYSLLEASTVKDEYKRRYSQTFVDKILSLAKLYGYAEFQRELELLEGKKQLGDIDLILKNENNTFLLIEAKNHSIPMDVYIQDQKATENRLSKLLDEWEAKVKNRQIHLERNHSNYGISSTFKYLIISKSPEILSHFSNFLVLSLDEFDHWLGTNNINATFDDIFNSVYDLNKQNFTIEQLDDFQKDLFPAMRFEKK